MLGLVLVTHNEGRRLELGLRQLARAMGQGARVLVIDLGSQDDTPARVRAFGDGAGRGADILRLDDAGLDMAAALGLARDRLGTAYVLGLGGQDLICPDAIAPLLARLDAEKPDLMICNHGWWLAGPGSVLPCADAARVAALAGTAHPERAALHDLLADPRRLLAGPDAVISKENPETEPELGQDWAVYDRALARAGRVALFGDMVLLRPMPADRSAAMFGLVEARMRAGPGPERLNRAERLALLVRLLHRLDDEMVFCDPARASDILAGATRLRQALPWGLRRAAARQPGPAGSLLQALHRGGTPAGLAVLAGLAAVQDRARLLALSAEIRALREDVDLALPGPDYLLELYERVRLT